MEASGSKKGGGKEGSLVSNLERNISFCIVTVKRSHNASGKKNHKKKKEEHFRKQPERTICNDWIRAKIQTPTSEEKV